MEQSEYYTNPEEAVDDAFKTQMRIEAVFGVEDDFILDVEENKSLQRNISNYVKATVGHLVKLKRRMNTLVAINKLPEELFTRIIILASLSVKEPSHLYLSYTWVCHHWRSTMIQDPIFWRSVRLEARGSRDIPIHPFTHEIFRRSESVELDMVLISKDRRQFPSTLENILAKESSRIRRLWLEALNDQGLLRMVSSTRFPALQGFSYMGGYDDFYHLLPVLVSANLNTLRCTLLHTRDMTKMDPLAAPMFSCIRNLSLSFDKGLLQSVLDMLHNNYTLQNLQLQINSCYRIHLTNQTTLPGLQYLSTDNLFLTEHILAPKLSSLDVSCRYSFMETFPETFDVSSIKYFYILESVGGCMLGLKERVLPLAESLFMTKTKDYVAGVEDVISTEHILSLKKHCTVNDILSDPCPRNCFRFRFRSSQFTPVLQMTLSPLIYRMQNLTELYLLNHVPLEYDGGLQELFSQAPSVEKLVIHYGARLMDFIRPLKAPFLCPRLKHLFYVTFYNGFIPREGINDYAEDIGRTLTECLQSRHKVHGSKLKHIILHYCPPLPDLWRKEIQSLGAMVATAKDAEASLNFFRITMLCNKIRLLEYSQRYY